MTWTDPPDLASAVRDSLAACAAWTGGAAAVHYPESDVHTDALPHAVIQEPETDWSSPVEGGGALPSGTVIVTLWLDASTTTVGQAEQLAEDLGKQLRDLQTGLVISGVSHSVCGVPEDAEIAEANETGKKAFYSIDLNIIFGPEG